MLCLVVVRSDFMNQLVLLGFATSPGGLATFVRRLFPETNYWEVGAPSAMGGIAIDVVVILGATWATKGECVYTIAKL